MKLQTEQIYQDPEARLDHKIDWSDQLIDGDTLASSTWTIPEILTNLADFTLSTSTVLWVTGGTDGGEYWCLNKIKTINGRWDERSFLLRVIAEKENT